MQSLMSSLATSSVIFAAAFAGALLGMLLQRVIPKEHLEKDSKEVIRLCTGLIATMAALVLGLLVSSAESSFNDEAKSYQQLALNVVMLDRTLAQYGSEAQPARTELKSAVRVVIDTLWPEAGTASRINDSCISVAGSTLYAAIRGLTPGDEMQKALQTQALQLATDLARDRWSLSQNEEGSLPLPFLIVLAFWLLVLFTSFGLFAPPSVTMILVLMTGALSVAGSVFLIVDLDQPFDGLLRISSASMRSALEKLGP
jgi:hypothetical protein